ncbi:uncharacterized protein HMPREF1541_09519 [Cyphellophora europaea CBS 101466]|uniref:Zn(2)-C6 fungal-type domain-containing protein n=1 Tax=Cyphellophora europaea (strain CBS 101466) TaxID=1220924 RepID=W2SAC9_CYPE1|nr:uncharacterized protein HMPREF1541_09519 [Cyphellophora europaea CBS 101466]ETN45686.1 hypothetical protein HMPREF1541_09519 [Cyphellophora europaea CBS 101466]
MPAHSKGCLTCRRRKVKCDETRPTCTRCQKIGRECGGYSGAAEPAPNSPVQIDSNLAARSRSGCTTCKQRKLKCDETWPCCRRCLKAARICRWATGDPRNLSSGGVDMDRITFYRSTSSSESKPSRSPSPHPDVTWDEKRAISFFHQRTAFHISGCNNSADRWFGYLLAVGETEPAIKHGVIALGALHEEFEALSLIQDRSRHSNYTPLQTLPETHLAVQQYSKAINLLAVAPSWSNRDIPLLATLLFAAFDSLRGRPEPALFHRCSGLRILGESSFSPSSPLMELLLCVFLHFDTENLELGEPHFTDLDSLPTSMAFTFPHVTRPLSGFSRLKQACEMFEVLYNRLLRAAKQPLRVRGPRFNGAGPCPQFPDIITRYGEWCYALDEYLRSAALGMQNIDQDGVSDLVIVQIRRVMLRIILHVDIRYDEMDFDRFAPEFACIVALAECFLNGCSRGALHLEEFEDLYPTPPTTTTSPSSTDTTTSGSSSSIDKGTYTPPQYPRAHPHPHPQPNPPPPLPPFSGPRRHLLGIIASHTPLIPRSIGALDTSIVASTLSIISRLPLTPFPCPMAASHPSSSPPAFTPLPNTAPHTASRRLYAKSAFSLAPGVIAPLWVVAAHCRDPKLRRRALDLLGRTHRKEGQWDSLVCAANGRAVMEAEEERAVGLARKRQRRRALKQYGGGAPGRREEEGCWDAEMLERGEVRYAWQVPDAARVREVEAVMLEGTSGEGKGKALKERKWYQWVAVGQDWSVEVPGCTMQ